MPSTEPVEAVIISGPRRGEIIQLGDQRFPEASFEEIEKLDAALDQLIAAIDRVSTEVRATTAALRANEER
jgi:hypothetical protein